MKIHTTKQPLRREEVIQRFGVRVTSPTRTIVDAADAGADPSVIMEAVARALASGLLTADELRTATRARSERVRRLIERAAKEAVRHAPIR